MKTRSFALTLFAGVALLVTSCVNQTEQFYGEIGKNDIAFKLAGTQTKAAYEDFVETREIIGSFKTEDGESFVLEESVVSLNGGPETKGTPAFTENVLDLYGQFSAVANPGSENNLPDAEFTFDSSTNYWTHHYYSGDVWDRAPFTFYLRMPSTPAGVTSAYTYNDDGSIEFDYTSPGTPAGQQDILFTSTTMNDEGDNGKSVLFYHVLTGIKFSNFYTNVESTERTVAKTIIKEVTLSGADLSGEGSEGLVGFRNSGHCKVNPSAAGTAEDPIVTWSNLSGNVSGFIVAPDVTKNPDYLTNYEENKYGLGDLLDGKATARNINEEDGSLTLWVVPQAFEDGNVKIEVKFDVVLVGDDVAGGSRKTHENEVFEVSLGARDWKAGQLHTFTLKPIVVGVELEDKMDDDKFVKSQVKVDNTGNVYEYVRVNLVGNWVGNIQTAAGVYDEEDDSILQGYINDVKNGDDYASYEMVEAWNDKDGKTNYGRFKNLTPKSTTVPAPEGNVVNNWVRYDKYYYYILPIGPDDSVTDQLFEKYEVGPSPDFYIPDQWGVRRAAGNVHLVMDLMVQAIPAPVDADGNVLDNDDGQGYIRAWVKALGKSSPNDLLDL